MPPRFQKRTKGVSVDDGANIQLFEVVVPQCKICKLPNGYRAKIDMMLATGWTQVAVREHWNMLLEDDYGPAYLNGVNVSSHARRHVSMREQAIRKIVEERAKQHNMDLEAVEGYILTKEAVAEAIIHSGLQNIVTGMTTVEPKEILGAIQLVRDLEEEMGSVAVDELWRQYYGFMDAVKVVVPEEMWLQIGERFQLQMSGNNTGDAMKELVQGTIAEDEEIVEAEDIDDRSIRQGSSSSGEDPGEADAGVRAEVDSAAQSGGTD